ncbi:hypothetical protein GCM10017778_46590 [Streptomyces vinaceus]|nr:hypothetical protein GCM10017778_46590 [Streptomyces vinaceus]
MRNGRTRALRIRAGERLTGVVTDYMRRAVGHLDPVGLPGTRGSGGATAARSAPDAGRQPPCEAAFRGHRPFAAATLITWALRARPVSRPPKERSASNPY